VADKIYNRKIIVKTIYILNISNNLIDNIVLNTIQARLWLNLLY